MKKVFILKHVANEGAGTLADFMKAKKIPFQTVELYSGEPLPSVQEAGAVLVMGGPMNVDEEAKHPFLKKETEFIQQLVSDDIPTLGVCLGSQLIAKALGTKVYKAAAPEIGWDHVKLTEEAKKDPLLGHISGGRLRVLQWHEDTFDLPKGTVKLASGASVPNQAYRYKQRVYAFQFHVEVDRPMLEDWFKNSEQLPRVLAEYDAYKNKLDQITERMYEKFFGWVCKS